MSQGKYLITTRNGVDQKQELWDSGKPFSGGYPFQWVLEKTSTGVRFRDLTIQGSGFHKGSSVDVNDNQIQSGARIRVPKTLDSFVEIKKIASPDPLFKTPRREKLSGKESIYVYSCVDEWVLEANRTSSTYTGSTNYSKVFKAKFSQGKAEITALSEQVDIETPTLGKVRVMKGTSHAINLNELAQTTVYLGQFNWRFGLSDGSIALDPSIVDRSSGVEDRRFRFIFITTAALFILAMALLVTFIPKKSQVAPNLEDESINLNIMRPKVIKKDKPLEKKAAVVPKKKVIKKPVEKKKPVIKKLPEKLVKKAPVKAPPIKRRIIRAAKAPPKPVESQAMKSLNALRAFNLGSQIQTSGINKKLNYNAPSVNSQSMFKGNERNLAPTNVRGAELESIETKTMGGAQGAAGGIGYAANVEAGVKDQGATLKQVGKGDQVIETGLNRTEIAGVVSRHIHEIRTCYNSALLKNRNIGGKMIVTFKVTASGAVSSAQIKGGGISDGTMKNCVIDKVGKWAFPPPKGGVSLSFDYPFNLRQL